METNNHAPAVIDAIVDRYERMMQRLIGGHAPEFLEVGITMAQAKVLYIVVAAGHLRMSDLAARLGIGLSSTSGLVDRLVELGYLERGSEPGDRRPVVVSATPSAHTMLERFRELNERQLRRLLDELDAAELDAVDQSLRILTNALDRAQARAEAAAPSTVNDRPAAHADRSASEGNQDQ